MTTRRLGVMLSICLVGVVASIERGVIGPVFGTTLSILLVLLGLTWTLHGTSRIRRLSELYLWFAFIFSIYYLHLVAETAGEWAGIQTIDAFRALAIVHLAVVVAAVWKASAKPRDENHLTAALLIVGAVIFWVGARTFPGSSLDNVSANMSGHLWTSINFLIATLVTLAGLALLARVMQDAGDRYLSQLGLQLFAFGAVFWTLHLAFRMTVVVQAVEYWRMTATAPPWFEPWRQWATILFVIYSVLAYCGLAAYGAALLKNDALPRWIGWTCICSGLIAAPLGGLPLFIHVPLWLLGILMLTRERHPAFAPA